MENSNPEEFMPLDEQLDEEELGVEELVDEEVSHAPNKKGKAYLIHVQTNAKIELPRDVPVLHVGKPNNLIPPDIDVSSYPDSDIVSRVHGDFRIEGDDYFFEDTGSSNGTYINNVPLPPGNRHRLRNGDRISLGKGDKVTFLFHTS